MRECFETFFFCFLLFAVKDERQSCCWPKWRTFLLLFLYPKNNKEEEKWIHFGLFIFLLLVTGLVSKKFRPTTNSSKTMEMEIPEKKSFIFRKNPQFFYCCCCPFWLVVFFEWKFYFLQKKKTNTIFGCWFDFSFSFFCLEDLKHILPSTSIIFIREK